jgi:hypothetical protein
MHYAANVLECFVDLGLRDDASAVLQQFFANTELSATDGVLREWTMYRRESALRVCTDIYASFLWLRCVQGRALLEPYDVALRWTIQHVMARLEREAEANGLLHAAELYAARELLPAFGLGTSLGMTAATEFAGHVVRFLDQNVQRAVARRSQFPDEPLRFIDSSIDRTRWVIEGWLRWHEVLLPS